jgi:hypothetical protein
MPQVRATCNRAGALLTSCPADMSPLRSLCDRVNAVLRTAIKHTTQIAVVDWVRASFDTRTDECVALDLRLCPQWKPRHHGPITRPMRLHWPAPPKFFAEIAALLPGGARIVSAPCVIQCRAIRLPVLRVPLGRIVPLSSSGVAVVVSDVWSSVFVGLVTSAVAMCRAQGAQPPLVTQIECTVTRDASSALVATDIAFTYTAPTPLDNAITHTSLASLVGQCDPLWGGHVVRRNTVSGACSLVCSFVRIPL